MSKQSKSKGKQIFRASCWAARPSPESDPTRLAIVPQSRMTIEKLKKMPTKTDMRHWAATACQAIEEALDQALRTRDHEGSGGIESYMTRETRESAAGSSSDPLPESVHAGRDRRAARRGNAQFSMSPGDKFDPDRSGSRASRRIHAYSPVKSRF